MAACQAAIDRYTRELTAAQKLDHPSINRLYEFGEDEGIYYVVSEWFEGEPLRKKIDQKVRPNSSQALNWIGQAGRALDEAAQAGACHGDVTPYNLVVLQDGSVKVVNFGLGHCRPKEDSIYRAPEQIFGDEGDPRSDLFCLGLLLYELLEGRHPFGGGSPKETQDRIVWGAVPPLTDAQPHLEAILQKLLAKRAVERYQSWSEAAADLAQGRAPTGQLRSLDDALPTAPGEASPSLAHFQLSTSDVLRARRILQERAMTAAARRRRAVFRVVKAAAAAALVVWLGRGIQRVRTENTVTLEEVKGDVRVTSFSAQPRKAVAGSRLQIGGIRTWPRTRRA